MVTIIQIGKKMQQMRDSVLSHQARMEAQMLQPYPPKNADEQRLTAHLERIEQKLDRIFVLLVTKVVPDEKKTP